MGFRSFRALGERAAVGLTGRVPRMTTKPLLDGSRKPVSVLGRGIVTVAASPSSAVAMVGCKNMAMLSRTPVGNAIR